MPDPAPVIIAVFVAEDLINKNSFQWLKLLRLIKINNTILLYYLRIFYSQRMGIRQNQSK